MCYEFTSHTTHVNQSVVLNDTKHSIARAINVIKLYSDRENYFSLIKCSVILAFEKLNDPGGST